MVLRNQFSKSAIFPECLYSPPIGAKTSASLVHRAYWYILVGLVS